MAPRVQDDLAILVEGSDGRYYFQAGAIVVPGTSKLERQVSCAATHKLSGIWRLEDKAGMPIDEIHESGHVPLCQSSAHHLPILSRDNDGYRPREATPKYWQIHETASCRKTCREV